MAIFVIQVLSALLISGALLSLSNSADDNNNVLFVDKYGNEHPDPNGYLAFCPCMGRLGNQADQFLGALAFAQSINRTLILPHWIEYIPYQSGSFQIPFDKYFKLEGVAEYHRVILMNTFMEKIAPTIWPPEKRVSFCYMLRDDTGCGAKDGNPFGPYWDHFKIDFSGSEVFGKSLHYVGFMRNETFNAWTERYPGDLWPVLAFVGPPSSFPVEEANVHLQKYLVWSEDIETQAKTYIKSLPRGPFVGIHMRNGMDWSRACELIDGNQRALFSSPQCTGYRQEKGSLTFEMCFPSPQTIIKQVKRAVKKIKATSVFVASDKNHMMAELSSALKNLKVTVSKLPYDAPVVDLAILGLSNIYIGNCVSSFSAFVKRERDVNGFPSEFWSFPPDVKGRKSTNGKHDEL